MLSSKSHFICKIEHTRKRKRAKRANQTFHSFSLPFSYVLFALRSSLYYSIVSEQSRLVGETERHAERRVDITLPLLLGDNLSRVLVQHLDVLGIELDEVLVGRDALGCDRLGQDGVAAGNCSSKVSTE
jgi:hypothetical protein